MQDNEIIELYFRRSEDAVRETQEKYGAYCMTIAHNLLGSGEDAEECVNDAYFDTWNTIPPERPQNLKAYVGALCRHRSIDRLRNRTALKRKPDAAIAVFDELQECIPSGEEDVPDTLALRDALNSFFADLPKNSRILFLQRYWYSGSLAKIAENAHMSESAVKSSLSRTREKLREHLKKEGF